jgi:diacylglycerol kinase family enzyme
MKRFHWLSVPYLTWLLFNRAIDKSKLHRDYSVKEATITARRKIHLHIDGEERGKVKKIHLKVVPGGVNMLA